MNIDIQKVNEEIFQKKFRICAKYIFLTYSQVPEEWSNEYVRKKLIDENLYFHKKAVEAYIIAEERHEEKGKHYHCLIKFYKKEDIKNQFVLDIEEVHGNYQAVKNIYATLNYIRKGKNYIQEGFFIEIKPKDKAVLEADTSLEAKLMLMDRMNVKDKLKLREERIETEKEKRLIREIALESADYEFQEIVRKIMKGGLFNSFKINGRSGGFCLTGEPNSGKTTLAYKIAHDLGEEVYVVDDPEAMTVNYKGQRIFLWDEMNKKKFEKYADYIALMITEPNIPTKKYYGSVKLPWPRLVLIATNEDVSKWKWKESCQARIVIIKTYKDDRYQFKRFRNGKIEKMTEEEIKNIK